MEGKSILFKEFGGVDSVPIVLDTQDDDEIIRIVKAIAPTYGGINLEDIAAPRCFKINEALQDIGIPVFHDDQFGTAIVVYAALLNAAIVTKKCFTDLKVVINGAGAAGISIAKMLSGFGLDTSQKVKNIIMCDSKGIIHKNRTDLNEYKIKLLDHMNKDNIQGDLTNALKDADVFIGVSKADLLKKYMILEMNKDPIIFALANPVPEIMPDIAKSAGAKVIATGRSDFPNQVNNVLVFPGIFKGALRSGAKQITMNMMIASAMAISMLVRYPTADKILPNPFEPGLAEEVAKAVEENILKF